MLRVHGAVTHTWLFVLAANLKVKALEVSQCASCAVISFSMQKKKKKKLNLPVTFNYFPINLSSAGGVCTGRPRGIPGARAAHPLELPLGIGAGRFLLPFVVFFLKNNSSFKYESLTRENNAPEHLLVVFFSLPFPVRACRGERGAPVGWGQAATRRLLFGAPRGWWGGSEVGLGALT